MDLNFRNIVRSLSRAFATRRRVRLAALGPKVEWEIRQAAASYRRTLLKQRVTGKHAKFARLAIERNARDKARALLLKFRTASRPLLRRSMLCSRFFDSPILDALCPNRRARWVDIVARDRGVEKEISLREFNLIDNPDGVLGLLKQIAEAELTEVSALLHFEDEHCSDIAPFLILAEFWHTMSPVFRGGVMHTPVQRVIEGVDLRRPLGMRLAPGDTKDVWAFPVKKRRATGSSRDPFRNLAPQHFERVCDQFCEAFSQWLGRAGDLELSLNGRTHFTSIIGELLNNAERHSDLNGDGSWSTAAFMERRLEDDRHVFRCHMAFLCLGTTIAEGLATAPAQVLTDITRYCCDHQTVGISRETLATVIALQDGVTRDRQASEHSRGGIGLQDVLDFVSVIGAGNDQANSPRVTIVSGNSCIKLRAPYLVGARKPDDARRMIWFNSGNSPAHPPDAEHVFDLEHRFPGTVISLSFTLDTDYLSDALNSHD